MFKLILMAALALSGAATGAYTLLTHFDPLQNRPSALTIPLQGYTPTRVAPWSEDRSWSVSGPSEFVSTFCPYAQLAANNLGVHPAPILAQAALETGWGKHRPAEGFNLFGIKATGGWKGRVAYSWTYEYIRGKRVRIKDGFRDYDNFMHAWWDYSRVIGGLPRYKKALAAGTDWRRYIQAVKDGGYSTDPQYVQKITSIIRSHKLVEVCPP